MIPRKAVFFILLFFIAMVPFLFYFVKFTKNPAAFTGQPKQYVVVEGEAIVPGKIVPLIKAGDTRPDQNGEENVKIISILDIKPYAAWKISFDKGDSVEIDDPQKMVMSLLLRMRCNKLGDDLLLRYYGNSLKPNSTFEVEFPGYSIRFTVIKVGEMK